MKMTNKLEIDLCIEVDTNYLIQQEKRSLIDLLNIKQKKIWK